MSVITNVVKALFSVSGDQGAVRAADNVGRAQTRLGSSATNAGRQFAAQSSGLGGLVAAYAGAAATAFALQAAFDGLSRSARALQTLEGLTALAAQTAQDGQRIVQSIREITNAQLTLVESAELANLSLSAGFNTRQIEGLSEVALRASRALGRDLTDAFTRVVRGSAKMETELLDELGIYTKIAPATRAYAAATGQAVSDLSEFERRQAFVNSVIAEGQRKFAAINIEIPTTSEKIEAFGAKIRDVTITIGGFIANALAPLAEFLTNNVGATLGVLGTAATLVLGKTLEVLNQKIALFDASIAERAARATAVLQRFNREAIVAGQAAARSMNLSPLGLSRDARSELSELRTQASARALSNAELARANTLLTARANILESKRGAILTEIKNQRALAANTALSAAERARANTKLNEARASLQRLRRVTVANRASMVALTAATTGAAGSFSLLASKATMAGLALVSNLGKTALNLVKIAGAGLQIVSILGLVVTAIANASGKGAELNAILNNTGQAISNFLSSGDRRAANNVFLGVTTNALNNLELVDSRLREIEDFTFNSKFLGVNVEITKTKEQLVQEVAAILADVSRDSSRTFGESLTSGWAASLSGVGAVLGTVIGGPLGTAIGAAAGAAIGAGISYWFVDNQIQVSQADANRLMAQFGTSLSNATPIVQERLMQALLAVEEQYSAASSADPAARAALRLQQQLVIASAEFLGNIEAVANIIAATGQSSAQIAANFDFRVDTASMFQTFSDAITEIAGQTITFRFFDIDNEQIQELINTTFIIPAQQISGITQAANDFLARLDPANLQTLRELSEAYTSGADIQALAEQLGIEDYLYSLESAFGTTQNLVLALEDLQGVDLSGLGISTINLAESFSQATGAINETNQITIRATEVLRQLQDGVNNASISLEQYEQGMMGAGDALIQARLSEVEIIERLITLRNEYAVAQLSGNAPQELARLGDLIEQEENRYNILTNGTIPSAENLLTILEAQRDVLEQQLELEEFLTEITPERANTYQTMFDNLQSFGLSSSEAMAAIASATIQDGQEYNRVLEESSQRLDALQLTEASRQAILQTTTANARERLGIIQDIENVEDAQLSISGDILRITQMQINSAGQLVPVFATINLTTGDIARNGQLYNGILEAQLATADEMVDTMIQLLAAQDSIVDSYSERISLAEAEADLAELQARNATALAEAYANRADREQAILAQERLVESLETELEIQEANNSLALESANNLVESRERALQLLEDEHSLSLDLLNTNQELNSLYLSIASSAANISSMAAGNIGTDALSTSLSNTLDSLRQAYNDRIAIIELEREQTEARIAAERVLAASRVVAARVEYEQAMSTYAARRQLLVEEGALSRLERDNELENLRARADAIEKELQVAERQRMLADQRDTATLSADENRALVDARFISEYLDTISTQNDVNTAFIDALQDSITQLAAIFNVTSLNFGPTQNITLGDARQRVEDYIAAVEEAYDRIEEQTLAANLSQEEAISTRLNAELSAVEAQILAQEAYNTEVGTLNSRRSNAELTLLRQQVRDANAVYQDARADLSRVTADALTQLGAIANDRAGAEGQYILGLMQQIEQYGNRVSAQINSWAAEAEQAAVNIASIMQEEIVANIRFEVDMQNLADSLAIARAESALEMLRLEERLISARESSGSLSETDAATETNRIQQEILDQQEAILILEREQFERQYAQRQANIRQEQEIARQAILQEATIAFDRIEAEYNVLAEEGRLLTAHVSGIADVNQQMLTGLATVFEGAGAGFATVLQSFLTAFSSLSFDPESGFSGDVRLGASSFDINFEAIRYNAESAIESINGSLSDSRQAAVAAIARETAARLAASRAEALRQANLASAEAALDRENFNSRLEQQAVLRAIEEENAAARIASAEEAGGAAEEVTDTLRERLLAIYDSIQSNLEDAFMELNDLLFYGEGDFGEILGNLFRSIQTDIFQTTIAEPLSRLITDNLFSAFGFEGGRQGIENARIDPVSGALFVRPVETAFGIQGVIDKSGEYLNQQNQGFLGGLFGQTRSELSGIFGGGGFLSNLMQSLFGQGGLFAGLLRGIGNLIRSIFGGVGGGGGLFGGLFSGGLGGGIGKASGGLVHMAQGGLLSASAMRRDRVPTMLEPGEFVVRRAAARSIGINNLQQMNATGQAPGTVQVNVTNNGTPQEATAAPPKFDGEKFIIDIVTRDLANNGPIRRSIRGGAI